MSPGPPVSREMMPVRMRSWMRLPARKDGLCPARDSVLARTLEIAGRLRTFDRAPVPWSLHSSAVPRREPSILNPYNRARAQRGETTSGKMIHSIDTGMVKISDIKAALGRIRDAIYVSPCTRSETFSQLTANTVYLKLDNLQRTGAFKERGALNKLLTLSQEERSRGVIAASAGNHAQGVAYHAGRHGIRAQICMPLTTPLTKVSATRGYGADVILHGANYDEAYEDALQRSERDHLTLVHAFDDDAVIAGQGTLGLEILQQQPEIEAIVAPIGGGGLIGGIACAVKETNARVQIFGVQPARLPSMKVAIAEGHPVTPRPAATIGEGSAVRRAGDRTLPLIQKYVDDIVTVDEEEIANAILLLLEREKTLAEGAGAAAIAALLNHKLQLAGKKVAVLVCGGNIDVTL